MHTTEPVAAANIAVDDDDNNNDTPFLAPADGPHADDALVLDEAEPAQAQSNGRR